MTKQFVTLYLIFKLFYLEFKKDYPKDYFDELFKAIKVNHRKSIYVEEQLLSISCYFLYSSQKRFDFCQSFIRYCNNFLDNIDNI